MFQAPLRIGEIYLKEGEFCLEALLECSNSTCRAAYPVVDGVPIILKDIGAWWDRNRWALSSPSWTRTPHLKEYFVELQRGHPTSIEAKATLSTYMDFHFGQFVKLAQKEEYLPAVSNADYWQRIVATSFSEDAVRGDVRSMDLGCAVGRFTFEMARHCDLAVGLDVDVAKVTAAARIQRCREVAFERRERGRIFRAVQGAYDPPGNVLFLVANALDPPFSAGSFDRVAALNLLDSVDVPLVLLGQMNALLGEGGSLVLGCPFEWRAEIADPSEWLETEDWDAPSLLRRLLEGRVAEETGFHYSIEAECCEVPWMLRSHARLQSILHSYVVRARKERASCQARDV